MAYEFLGTFNQAQFDRFSTFAVGQLQLVAGRINHLQAEIGRIGRLSFAYDNGGVPVGYKPDSSDSYIAKLLAAYEILGGDAYYDLNVRSVSQAVFIVRASETSIPQLMSNGEIMGSRVLADAPTAELMQEGKAWVSDALHYRRDYLERKIRRMVDYVDQLQAEVAQLRRITESAETIHSLASVLNELQSYLDDRGYKAVTKDTDPHNKSGYAPFAAYEPGPEGSTADIYQRTLDGPVGPGSKGNAKA